MVLNKKISNEKEDKIVKLYAKGFWTESEESFLKDNYDKFNARYFAETLNRSLLSVQWKCKDLNLHKREKLQHVRPSESSKIEILISWGEFDKLKDKDLIPFECIGCGNIYNIAKDKLRRACLENFEHIYCSIDCRNVIQKAQSFLDWPTEELLKSLIYKGLNIHELSSYFKKSKNRVYKWIRFYNLTSLLKEIQRPILSKKQSDISKNFFINNPDSDFLKSRVIDGISIPCEKVKKDLRYRSVEFTEEVALLTHLGKKFRADIVFDEFFVIIEINGKQHYAHNGNLTWYYQKRHNDFVNSGWRVFEIPSVEAMKPDFLDNILPLIFDKTKIPDIKPFFLKQNNCKCGRKISTISKQCRECFKNSFKCPLPKNSLHWFIWNFTYPQICKYFNISKTVLRKWIKDNHFVELPTDGYRSSIRHGKTVDYQI
jgi:very-short-patch-repair endonuclease